MPHHKSCKKRMKTSAEAQTRNRAARSALRSALRNIREIPTEQRDTAEKEFQSVVDRAVKSGIMHRNKAARLKSRFTRRAS